MTTPVRNGVMFVVLLILAVLVYSPVSAMWARWIGERRFSSPYPWWSSAHALHATDEFLLLLVVGIVLPVALRVRRPIAWACAFGVAFGFVLWSVSWNWVNPESGLADYFWAYSSYLAPVLGAVAGTCLTLMLWRKRARNVA